jgi:PAS domain-containing protein
MASSQQSEADRGDGFNTHSGEQQSSFAAQLRKTLNTVPAYTWYAAPTGALTFVNERTADYLGLPKDHPLRFGIDTGAACDSHIPLHILTITLSPAKPVRLSQNGVRR